MANKIIWNDAAIKKVKGELASKLELVGQYVEGQAIKNVTDMGAVDSGRLKNSITHETDKNEFVTRIGTNVEYAKFVELGTVKNSPRPFLRFAIYLNEQKIKDILTK